MRVLGKNSMEPGKRPNLFPRHDRVPALRGAAGEGSAARRNGCAPYVSPTTSLGSAEETGPAF